MANELIAKWGTQKTLEANGVSLANNAIAQADDATYGVVADGAGYPDADFALTVTYATAPTENATLDLYAQELDIDGTADTQTPEASAYRPRYICSFPVNNVTTAQTIAGFARDVPKLASYYLFNNGTGQTVGAGWVLKITPRTVGPA